MKQLLGGVAALGALIGLAAIPAHAEPDPTPPPYCAGSDPGDLLNGVTCEEQLNTTEAPVSTRPSDPPPGGNLPGGGDGPGGGGPGGGGPGGGG